MASKLYAMWTHGCAAKCESPNTRALYQGFGVTFSIPNGQTDWIHIPVPTPPIVRDKRVKLQKVFYLFNAVGGAKLNGQQIYDGPNALLGGGGGLPDFEGDHSRQIDGPLSSANWTAFENLPEMRWGLGISLRVASRGANSRFYISTAGADFRVDE